MIPALQECSIVSIFGPVRSGKTFLMKELARSMDRVLNFDPTMEWTEADGFEVFAGWQEETGPRALAARLEKAEKENAPFRIAYYPGDVERGFEWSVNAIWQMSQPRWLIVEEINLLMSPMHQHDSVNKLIRFSRKRLLGVMGASQAIADVHKNFTRNSRTVVIFNTTEPRDYDTINERWGEEVADAVEQLRPLKYADATGIVEQKPQAVVVTKGEGWKIIEP